MRLRFFTLGFPWTYKEVWGSGQGLGLGCEAYEPSVSHTSAAVGPVGLCKLPVALRPH